MILDRVDIIKRTIGPFRRRLCQHCRNEGYWQAQRVTVWLAVYAMPVMPLGFEYRLVCPVCFQGHGIRRRDYRLLKTLAKINSRFYNCDMSAEEYDAEVDGLEIELLQKTERLPDRILWGF